jgi:AcrR family transcriptional regulator
MVEVRENTAGGATNGAGRPRDAAIDRLILAEALREIAEHGIAGFNYVSVARGAGVAKNTVRLRYPKREDLIKAALMQGDIPERPPLSGDLREDLATLADEFAAVFASDIGLVAYYQLSVTSRTDPEMWAWGKEHIIDPSHAMPERVLIEAQRRGTARPDFDAGVVARMLVGAIYTEAILQIPHGYVSPEFRRILVDNILSLVTNQH